MKTFFLNLILILFCTPLLFSQEREQNSEFKNYSSSIFDKKETALSLFLPSEKKEETATAYLRNQNSGVSIEQIGNYNQAIIQVQSDDAVVLLNQQGDYNNYFLEAEANKIAKEVSQKGNSNIINDYSNGAKYNVNTQMSQNGNNQSIQNFGVNSLSENMKVIQKGNGASVIIINYR